MIDLNTELVNAKEQDHLSVIEIYDISLRTGMMYICNTDKDIEFEGHKYVSIPIEREEISQSTDNIDGAMKITMADATTEQLQFVIAGFDFRGCQVRVRQILYPNSINDNSICRDMFYGYIDNPAYENGEFSCTLRSRIHKVTVPRRTFQSTCNCKFGDDICTMDVNKEIGKIIDVLDDNKIAIEKKRDDGYWNNGIIVIEGESRMIQKSTGATVTTFYPFFATITRGENYAIQRGCDKTIDTCTKYGNAEHFAGFPSIPFEDIYR